MSTLVERVAAVLDRHGLGPATRVAVACSGGADSTALADAAMGLARAGRLGPVTLIYVDHGLRPGAAEDRAWVEALAARGGGRPVSVPVDVDRRAASLEAAAREARYQALDREADARGLDWVLTAHTASDQAETVLMRILRGSGLVGLAAIPVRRGRYLRPLLGVTRAEVLSYLAGRGLPHVHDETNDSPRFLRNRVRHQLLPRLAAENPGIAASLCRIADAAEEQRQVLDFAARQLLAAVRGGGPAGVLAVAGLRAAPAAVAKRALALAALAAGGDPLEARHQALLLRLSTREAAGTLQLDLPRLRAIREYGWLRLERPLESAPRPLPRVEVSGPDGPYGVRSWRPGDRMRPARLRGRSRKLSDLYADGKIPRRSRVDAVVVVRQSDGVIVWAEFVGTAVGSQVEVALTRPDSMDRNSDNQ